MSDLPARVAAYRALAHAAAEAFVIADVERRVTFLNPAAERLFGPADLVTGRALSELMADPSAPDLCAELDRLADDPGADGRVLGVLALGADGHGIPAEVTVARWEEHGRVLFGLIVRDISERHRTQMRLERYREIVQHLPLGLTIWRLQDLSDGDTLRLLDVNEGNAETLGVDLIPLIGHLLLECLPGLAGTGLPEALAEVVRSGTARVFEDRRYQDERVAAGIFAFRAFPLPDRSLGLVVENVTPRKRVEDALREAERRYRVLVDAMWAVVWRADPDTLAFTFVSRRAEVLLGFPVSNWLSDPGFWAARLHPDDRETVLATRRAAVASGQQSELEYRLIAADDRVLWILERLTPPATGEGTGEVIGIFLDVTERKDAEARVRESERRLAEAQRLARLGSWEWDVLENRLTWSEEMTRIYGLEAGVGPGSVEGFLQLVHPEDRARAEQIVGESLERRAPFAFMHRIARPDGGVRWLQARGEPVLDSDGSVRRLVGTAQDVTERREADEVLRASQERFRILVDGVRDYAILLVTPHGLVSSWNAGAERILGYRAEDILGSHFSRFYPADERASGKAQDELQVALLTGRYEEEGRRVRRDGSAFLARVTITPLLDAAGRLQGFAKVVHDITEQKASEEKLASSHRQLRELSRRLEALREQERGRMAREIHDELGQALTAIKLDLTSISRRLREDSGDLRSRIANTMQLVDGTIDTVRRVSQELRPGVLDDLGLVPALEWLCQDFEQRTGISCRPTLPAREIGVDADRATHIFRIAQEALTNVVRHAEARSVTLALRQGAEGKLHMVIQDDGRGMAPPAPGAALSLGLLGMRERAAACGGELRVVSPGGGGTLIEFQMPLPMSEGRPA